MIPPHVELPQLFVMAMVALLSEVGDGTTQITLHCLVHLLRLVLRQREAKRRQLIVGQFGWFFDIVCMQHAQGHADAGPLGGSSVVLRPTLDIAIRILTLNLNSVFGVHIRCPRKLLVAPSRGLIWGQL